MMDLYKELAALRCFTHRDMVRLTADHIRQVGEETWLTMQTSKTGKLVQIPLTIIFYGADSYAFPDCFLCRGQRLCVPSQRA